MVGVLGAKGGEGVGGAGIGQGAARLQIRQQNRFVRAEDLGGLRHEVDPAEDDHLGVSAGGLAGELERVADEIGHVLDLGTLVIVRQDHGLAGLAQLVDRGRQVVGDGWGCEGRKNQPRPQLGQDDPSLGSRHGPHASCHCRGSARAMGPA